MSEGEEKVALITGITGQDGSYLAELLLEKGYSVSRYLIGFDLICDLLVGCTKNESDKAKGYCIFLTFSSTFPLLWSLTFRPSNVCAVGSSVRINEPLCMKSQKNHTLQITIQ